MQSFGESWSLKINVGPLREKKTLKMKNNTHCINFALFDSCKKGLACYDNTI